MNNKINTFEHRARMQEPLYSGFDLLEMYWDSMFGEGYLKKWKKRLIEESEESSRKNRIIKQYKS